MNNESTLKSVGSIFTGKGGTIRTAIVSIVILAVFGEIMDSKYQFTLGTSNGETMSLKPFVNSENNESSDSENQEESASKTPEETAPVV